MKKIIIAGAGFGGVRAALDLSKCLPDEIITLINNTPYHCYHADLYEVATAVLEKEGKLDFKNLSGTINIPLKKIFNSSTNSHKKNVEILIDEITTIDLEKEIVTTKNSANLNYDYLVLGLGSTSRYYDITGAEDFSHPLKSAADALNIRNDLEELIINCSEPFKVVIAGGGYTGVETAGQLVSFLENLSKKYKKDNNNLIILEGSDKLLSGMPDWSQKTALVRLRNLGVEVLLNYQIEKIEKDKIYCKGKEVLSYDYLIWTTGVAGATLQDQIKGISLTKKNKVETKADLSLEKFPEAFVLGDLAEFLDNKTGNSVPATAWAAIGQGSVVAKNIVAKINNQPTSSYNPPDSIFVVPIGRKYALSNFADLKITGVAGWFLKRTIALKYFLSILPFFDAINMWRKGVNIYLAND